ncbi:MAG: VWA domain-containing protein, partial [Bacteroidota bacterium]
MIAYLKGLTFASPSALLLLALPLLFVLWQIWQYRRMYPTLTLPILVGVKNQSRPVRGFIKKYLFVLRMLAVSLLIVALARPQEAFSEEEVNTEGIDIVIAVDVSTSMLARDFQPNRLEAAKQKAQDFIQNRPNDRIGLVVFAGESFTQSPLTTDKIFVQELLGEIKNGLIPKRFSM